MKVFMIGGTGLLGSEAARELIARGHEVISVALPPLPEGAVLPQQMKIVYGNYLEMTDVEIENYMVDCEGFVFAAGVDERVEGPAPIYDFYKKYNIDPIRRLLTIAKRVGVKHVAVCGSYFAHFAKVRPELELTKYHPYIRSRIDQENAAMSFADDTFDVAVLELPYIFGTQPGRKPVWMFMAEQIVNSKKNILYPKGGSAMVTVKQVGQAIAGAIELNKGGNCYPIGYYNKTWIELIGVASQALGYQDKKVTTIPDFLYKLGGAQLMKEQKKKNIQGGLHMVKFSALQCSNLFIDKSEGAEKLGVKPDDIDSAIADSMKLCKAIMEKKVNSISMRGE
ncbi:MAG: NAD(P)-dependent oxidoreductase [Pseudobutyrivibrio sp.]|nr:NAD(P)-dependent oxidoreductase [Pseudobutyrivibrio sp.]